ncbi:SDR family NAD(P)-dependent oxidoreductase [Paenibacillus sp. 7523-1]|uniref:SDR family NAD(P)-dependent oxidoreductase n=1 Tax=Paenibacillus sp. 7523-1 TaxID=2022550 RepID=UPI000BA67B84|nr:SDR family oxidoreductase [Paenibacillus sp. 7523-1]PAD28286.1 hypothetical protein CHH60_27075 [Paenibacillus sp. 7523-1]
MSKKLALVTGGSTGIGLGIMKKFLSSGEWNVVSISRSGKKIEYAKEELKDFDENYEFITGDILNESSLQEILNVLSNKYYSIDSLVNCAGIIYPGGIEGLSLDDWKKSIDVNLTGAFSTTQIFLEMLKASNIPSVINISSISSTLGGSSIAYSVSKAGMDMLTKTLAKELSEYKIRVNSVNPGVVKSGFQVANGIVKSEDYEDFLESASKSYPFGVGRTEDIANMVFYLASEEAEWITGSIFTVDGGRSINI